MSGANATDPTARAVHGTNPQNLVERITRDKIYAMTYWKERCFGVSAAALVDLAMEVREVGGVFGGTSRCTNFLCLVLKMLQIQPEKEIVVRTLRGQRSTPLAAHASRAPRTHAHAHAHAASAGGVHQERGLQVRAPAGRLLPAVGGQAARRIPILRSAALASGALQLGRSPDARCACVPSRCTTTTAACAAARPTAATRCSTWTSSSTSCSRRRARVRVPIALAQRLTQRNA
jgi:hypothetical protein